MSARVVIADDHPPTRADIRDTLEAGGGFQVVGEAADAPSAVDTALRAKPDLCLLDIRMPGSGIAAAWEITARLPETKVVMLTVSRDDDHLFAALRAGAVGYLLKDVDPGRLTDELERVLAGEATMPRALLGRLFEDFRDRAGRRRKLAGDDRASQLTSREWEVLELMRSGLSTAEMARRLTLSQATVRSHVAALLRKLRVPDRESAVRLFDNGR